MRSRWSDAEAEAFVARHAPAHGEALALRTYSSRLIGAEAGLVLHGGGNTSLKGVRTTRLGESVATLFVKASGHDLATIEPEAHVPLALESLRRLLALPELSDAAMADELSLCLLDARAPAPSIEALVHAVIPGACVDHTHADAILALCNRSDGDARVREALGAQIPVLPYAHAGFALAKVMLEACAGAPDAGAMVWSRHGIVTWAATPRESYERMLELVSRAEARLEADARRPFPVPSATALGTAEARLERAAPLVRGRLATPTGDADRPHRRVILRRLVTRELLDFLETQGGRELALSPPLTADHLIRTKPLPAWLEAPDWDDEARLGAQLDDTLASYAQEYRAYLDRHAALLPAGVAPADPLPRVLLLPGAGMLCAGRTAREAEIARDIAARALAAKASIAAAGGTYRGLDEAALFAMEYRPLQQAKLERAEARSLVGDVALVTGAAGAIGAALCTRLLEAGAHVAATDLAGERLEDLTAELGERFPGAVTGVPLDVTDADSVREGFAAVTRVWGGVDHVVINAGLAHVAGLEELDLARFRRLEEVNVEGTLLLLREAGGHLRRQATGGDLVLVSTKNVFAPGARFGAYSATKAAAHQLARIASLELAEHDVRVNMVAPDAVFAHGARRSGLWAEVGPDRMRARGLDAAGLEEYYRSRNLLKARVTADHVASAVLFFLTRQTPTTGATLPVDGGLPDATPR
jgi:rhamnose utilization protein RhaD (predicted bifunctional aldolase and dehydrogenase)/NAD(P)-dependent dehydrogenase (short-subunit alcohol dehydrogenase family)